MTQLGSDIAILPEASIFEWDKPNKGWHNGLATLQERKNYFPRINADYQSLFVPELPGKKERKKDKKESETTLGLSQLVGFW